MNWSGYGRNPASGVRKDGRTEGTGERSMTNFVSSEEVEWIDTQTSADIRVKSISRQLGIVQIPIEYVAYSDILIRANRAQDNAPPMTPNTNGARTQNNAIFILI